MFQFINSFASLFYIAFIKPFMQSIDPCTGGSCMIELQTTLGTIFLTRMTVGNVTELGVPLVTGWWTTRQSENAARLNGNENAALLERTEISDVEKTYLMPKYDVMLGTFDDYASLVIQFGYTTMFISAFPLATVLSFVHNYVELRVDGWKLCQLFRRPEPRSCEDIGTWHIALELIATAAIFTNSAIVGFTGSMTGMYTWTLRIWIFILMATGLFCIRLSVQSLVPDVSPTVEIQLARQEYIQGKVINNVPDEDDDEDHNPRQLVPEYTVKSSDDDPL
jgi:Calcium-activated chloride channel